jgi:hypothetical protein
MRRSAQAPGTFKPWDALARECRGDLERELSHEHCPSSPAKTVRAAMGCSVRFVGNPIRTKERQIEGLTGQRCAARGKGQRKTRRVESAGSTSAFSGVSLYPPHRCFPSNGLAVLGSLIPSCRLGRLRLFLDWACRQLQYGSPLPRSEVSDKNDCTV